MTGQAVVGRGDAHTPADLRVLIHSWAVERPRGDGTPGAVADQNLVEVVDSA
jgi:hypothetical protein